MRDFDFFRKSIRKLNQKRASEPDMPLSTTKRKKFTGSYADLMNLPSTSFGTDPIQDPATGFLVHMMDYDPW